MLIVQRIPDGKRVAAPGGSKTAALPGPGVGGLTNGHSAFPEASLLRENGRSITNPYETSRPLAQHWWDWALPPIWIARSSRVGGTAQARHRRPAGRLHGGSPANIISPMSSFAAQPPAPDPGVLGASCYFQPRPAMSITSGVPEGHPAWLPSHRGLWSGTQMRDPRGWPSHQHHERDSSSYPAGNIETPHPWMPTSCLP